VPNIGEQDKDLPGANVLGFAAKAQLDPPASFGNIDKLIGLQNPAAGAAEKIGRGVGLGRIGGVRRHFRKPRRP